MCGSPGSTWKPSTRAQDGEDRTGGEVAVKLGVWLSSVKSPARRAKLTGEQLGVLAALGLEWAGSTARHW
jgi:hypothetical protein